MESQFQIQANNLSNRNNRMWAAQNAYGGPLGISLLPVNGALDYMQNNDLLALTNDAQMNNMKKFSLPKFAFGGALGGYGGDWSNGLNFIKAGGTHEENPIGGVPAGIAQDGVPNLVEEGEVIWNDYVFSDRIKVPKTTLDRLNIKGKENNITFAEAVAEVQKFTAERPNDPIEQRGLEAALQILMQEQEILRQKKMEKEEKKEMNNMKNIFSDGGLLIDTPDNVNYNYKKNVLDLIESGIANNDYLTMAKNLQEFAAFNEAKRIYDANKNAFDIETTLFNDAFEEAKNKGQKTFTFNGKRFDTKVIKNKEKYQDDAEQFLLPVDPVYLNNNYDNGGPIYIKPENKGKLTALKKRTGKTEAELFAEGSPSVRKMITFARNSRTWNKKADGGYLDNILGDGGWKKYLRGASALGPAVGLGYTLSKQPTYDYAKELEDAANQYTKALSEISYQSLGDYLRYEPVDKMFSINELNAADAGLMDSILANSGANRSASLTGLLAAHHNNTIGIGKLHKEKDEYGLTQRQKVAEFNRATNQYNSEADLKAQIYNAEMAKARANMLLNAKQQALALKQTEDQAWNAALAENLTGLFNNLGDIGKEAIYYDMMENDKNVIYKPISMYNWELKYDNMLQNNPFKPLPDLNVKKDKSALYKPTNIYNWKLNYDNMLQSNLFKPFPGLNTESKSHSYGGFLTIKNRRKR
jgi:hypothetical protein